jgi:hypothetical protein
MKERLGNKVLLAVGCLLVVVGVGPLAISLWQVSQSRPLSEQILLKRGEYNSPYFRTYLSGNYQVELTWLGIPPDVDTDLDLDWKVVDSSGAVIQQGTHSGRLLGNDVILGYYRAGFAQRQRVILTVHQDVEGNRVRGELGVGQPELGLDISYGFHILLGWAVVVGGPGLIIVCVALISWAKQRDASETLV